MRIAVYARVSTQDQHPEAQLQPFREYRTNFEHCWSCAGRVERRGATSAGRWIVTHIPCGRDGWGDRERQCGAFRTSRASPAAPYSAKPRKLDGKPALVSSLSRFHSSSASGLCTSRP